MAEREKNCFGQYVLISGIKQLAVFPGGCWGLENELHRARWRARGQFGDCCYKFLVRMQSLRAEWTSGLSLVLNFFRGSLSWSCLSPMFLFIYLCGKGIPEGEISCQRPEASISRLIPSFYHVGPRISSPDLVAITSTL